MPEKVDNPKSDANKWDISTEREKIKRETLLVGEGDVAKELRVVKTYVFETWYLACLP